MRSQANAVFEDPAGVFVAPLGQWQVEVDEELATAGFGPRTWSTTAHRWRNDLM